MTDQQRYQRPAMPGAGLFEAQPGGVDPAERRAAADRCAALLIRGATSETDAAVAERVVHLAETEGLETLADLWSGSAPDSLAGCLWRLYLIRSWVYADPAGAALEFASGRSATPVDVAVAGVIDPPGPDEVRALADAVLRGVVDGDFADTLFRAAAFTRVAAAGRARKESGVHDPHASDLSAARLMTLADQLERAGHLELAGLLH